MEWMSVPRHKVDVPKSIIGTLDTHILSGMSLAMNLRLETKMSRVQKRLDYVLIIY